MSGRALAKCSSSSNRGISSAQSSGALRAARKARQRPLRRAHALHPGSGQQFSGAIARPERPVKRPLRSLQPVTAQGCAYTLAAPQILLRAGGDQAGREQPVQLLLGERAIQPAQHKQCRPRQTQPGSAERPAKTRKAARAGRSAREMRARSRPAARWRLAPPPAAGRSGLAASCGCTRSRKPPVRLGRRQPHENEPQLPAHPAQPRATPPGVEKAALDRQNPVKSGQKQRRTLRRVSLQQRNQLQRQTARAQQISRRGRPRQSPQANR